MAQGILYNATSILSVSFFLSHLCMRVSACRHLRICIHVYICIGPLFTALLFFLISVNTENKLIIVCLLISAT